MTDIMEIDACDPIVLAMIEVNAKKQVTLFWIPNQIAKISEIVGKLWFTSAKWRKPANAALTPSVMQRMRT